jgi:hypothetical protein
MEISLSFFSPIGVRVNILHVETQSSPTYSIRVLLSHSEHQKIETYQLFGFNSSILHRKDAVPFRSDCNIEVTLALEPGLQASVTRTKMNPQEFIQTLQQFSHDEPTHLLLNTESWLILSAQQEQDQKIVDYRTVWDYLDWTVLEKGGEKATFDTVFSSAITHFVQDAVIGHSRTENAANILQSEAQLIESLLTLAPGLFSQPDTANQQVTEAMTRLFRESLESELSESGSPKLSKTLERFFQEENWAVLYLAEQSVLQLKFQGSQGQWHCYAQAKEAEQQVIFYSVLPVKAPGARRSAIAEFITRANYGIVLGNFEMDFSDGEIRYKTSVGVEGSFLDVALIRQLVYSNLLITDKYLPGIQAVIQGRSAALAIARVENPNVEVVSNIH